MANIISIINILVWVITFTMKEEKVDTYSTKVEPQQTLEIPKNDDSWDDVLDDNGVIPTTLNVPVMVQRLAKDIYKNATSGIRELYMNAVRGCTDGVELFGYKDPHITVTINKLERIITIEDNGRGITKARFKQVLRKLGTSDNFDGKTTGQFGMGFASYMTLASVCVLDTIGDNGDNYKMLCRDGTSSKPAGKADIDSHGVKLTLTCYPKVNFHAVCDKLYDTARHASVPTTVIIEEFEYAPNHFRDGVNEIKQVKFDENIPDDVKENMMIIDTEDFTLIGSDTIEYDEGYVYLLNVPIDSEIEVPFSYWTINIKDERKFQPMPDRDRMREESDEVLQAKITDAIHEHFSTMNIETYDDYINSEYRVEYLWLMDHIEYAPELMQQRLRQLNNCISLREVIYAKEQPAAHRLSYWLRVSGAAGITYQGFKNKAYTGKVKQYIHQDCKLIIAKKGKNYKWQDSVKILEDFGVPIVKQILKDNKVKIPKLVKENIDERTILGHEHVRMYNTKNYIYKDIDDTFIRTDILKMNDMISFVRNYPTNMTFLRNEPILKNTECQSLSGWLDKFKHVKIKTNKGLIVADTLALEEKLYYCPDLKPGFDDMFKELDETYILENYNILGVALLRHLNHQVKSGNLLDIKYMNTLFESRYGINIYNDKVKKYVISHLKEIQPVYHELFVRVVEKYDDKVAYDDDEIDYNEMDRYLEKIKEFDELDSNDEIEKLKFYHSKWLTLPNKQAVITRIFYKMMVNCQREIRGDQYLLNKFVQEEVLVKLFDGVEVRKCKVKEDEWCNERVEVSFTTNQRSISLKSGMKVLGMNISISNLDIRLYKGFSLIGADVKVSL